MKGSLIISSGIFTDRLSIKDSPAYAVYLLFSKLSELSKLNIRSNELKSEIKNQQAFVSKFKAASVFKVMDLVLNETIEKQKVTWVDGAWYFNLELDDLDSFFDMKEYVSSLGKLSDFLWIKVEKRVFDRQLRTLMEFLDSAFEINNQDYMLNAIVLEKKNVYNIIVETSLGVSYYKMTAVMNFSSWGEALFCAFEADFYPCLFLYAKVNQEEKNYLEFLNDDVKDGIANLISLKNCEIRSVNRYIRYKDIEISAQTDSDSLTQDTLEAFKIIYDLNSAEI